MVREGRVFVSTRGHVETAASGYNVQALEVGAQVTSGSSGSTVTVRAGHGFAAGDKWLVKSGDTISGYSGSASVTSVDATHLYLPSSISVAAGDFLLNMANDTGITAPQFNSSGLTVYTDMDYSNAATSNTVQTDSVGRYRYYHRNIGRWELVRATVSGAVVYIAVYTDTGAVAVNGPSTGVSVDNTVARWDGTTGNAIQGSPVVVSDAGAMSGVTSLTVAGAVTGVTQLTTSSAVTVGTDLSVTGDEYLTGGLAVNGNTLFSGSANTIDHATSFGSTISVSGTSTLTGGIAGGLPANAGTWPINSATDGTDTACTNGTAYCGSIYVPANCTITGIQYLVGSVGGTNLVVVSLHNSAGVLLKNSATAGTTVGTAAQLQQVPFTSSYSAKGPTFFFVAVTFNGATAKFRTIPLYCNVGSGVLGNGVAQTFGAPASFTAPTTFTQNTVPVASIY